MSQLSDQKLKYIIWSDVGYKNQLRNNILSLEQQKNKYWFTICTLNSFLRSKYYLLYFMQKTNYKALGLLDLNQMIPLPTNKKSEQVITDFLKNQLYTRSKFIELGLVKNIDYDFKKNMMRITFHKSVQQKDWEIKFKNQDISLSWKKLLQKEIDDYTKKQTNTTLGMQTTQTIDKNFIASHLAQKKIYLINEEQQANSPVNRQGNDQNGGLRILKEHQEHVSVIRQATSGLQSQIYRNKEVNKKQEQDLLKIKFEINKQMQLFQSTKLQLQNLKHSQKTLSKKYEVLKLDHEELLDIFKTLGKQKETVEEKLAKAEEKLAKMEKQLEQTQLAKRTLQQEASTLIYEKRRLQDYKDAYEVRINELQNQLIEQTQKITEKMNEIHELMKANQKFQVQIQNLSLILARLSTQTKGIQELNLKIHTELEETAEKVVDLQREELPGAIKKQIEALEKLNYLHKFEGEVLHDYFDQKYFLCEQIEKYTKKEILYTKLLYQFDKLNKTNFHQYIDEYPNICLILRLKNGRMIAAFSIDPISTKRPAVDGGLILSLTYKRAFPILVGKRSVTHDAYFLIVGNSEMRLKHGDNKFFTNFGVANSYYESYGEKYTILSGEGAQREEQLEHFQIFQVIYK